MIRKWLLGIIKEAVDKGIVSSREEITLVIKADTTQAEEAISSLGGKLENLQQLSVRLTTEMPQ